MKTKRIKYRNNKKTFRKKNKYNKKGGVWWFGDITGRKNVDANRYRELKNKEDECVGLKDQIVSLQTRINELKDELKSMKGRDFAKSVAFSANKETMRDLYDPPKKEKQEYDPKNNYFFQTKTNSV